MIQHGGMWYPDEDVTFHVFHPVEAQRDLPWFLKNVKGRGTIVQAGANVGTYPLALADHFQKVWTFEPDPQSWECLQANLKARDCHRRITALHAALGAADGRGMMQEHPNEPGNWGARYVAPESGGDVRVVTIDWLHLSECDAIWLDVEGAELPALKGAVETIMKFSPVIVTEENGNGARFGVDQHGIADFLETLGYSVECGIGRDRYYRRANG